MTCPNFVYYSVLRVKILKNYQKICEPLKKQHQQPDYTTLDYFYNTQIMQLYTETNRQNISASQKGMSSSNKVKCSKNQNGSLSF